MKKTLRLLPALLIAVAAGLCLSFDNNGKLSFLNNTEEQAVLFQTTLPSGSYKGVLDNCPDGKNFSLDCQTGGSAACTPKTCPTTMTGTLAI